MYLDANDLYGEQMSQNLFVDGLIYRLLMKKFDKLQDKEYILEVDVDIVIFFFYQKE